MLSSRELAQQDNELQSVKKNARPAVRPFIRAIGMNLRVIGDVFAMIVLAAGVWFLWGWALPVIWPAGPAAFIQPGFWHFAGLAVAARCIWNIVFLCPKAD